MMIAGICKVQTNRSDTESNYEGRQCHSASITLEEMLYYSHVDTKSVSEISEVGSLI